MPPQKETSVYDLAYRGKTAAVKILINENQNLKTETDEVNIFLIPLLPNFLVTLPFSVQNKRMLIHWAALGGHEDLVIYLLSIGFPVDPEDDVSFSINPLIILVVDVVALSCHDMTDMTMLSRRAAIFD